MSMKEIARRAGTSVATVSRVLNQPGHHCHEKGLEEKIWQLASELNYVPNTAAVDLRRGNAREEMPYTVDIYLTRFHSMEQDAFFLELFGCLKEELLQNGCVLGEILHAEEIMILGQETNPSVHIPYKSSTSIQSQQKSNTLAFISEKPDTGLIILGKCPANLIPTLKKRYRCIAGIDRNPTDYEYDEVICNGTTAAEMAVEYLISLGHKNIAYIGDCNYESRYIGYYQSLLKHHLPLNHGNVHPTNQTMEEGISVMNMILKSKEKPTAIFCANDTTALGVLKALKSSQKKEYIPSVISIDNISASEKTDPMLTTIHIPKKEMAHLAFAMLLDRKNGKHKEAVRVELPCRLLKRESCYLCV